MSTYYEALKRAKAERGDEPRGRQVWTAPVARGTRMSPPVGYQRIRAWLTNRAVRGERIQTMMVVSCRAGTGSTTTASLLAAALAEGKQWRVLIIDANLRMPSLNTVFNVRNRGGVTAVVGRGLPYEAQIEATSRENLFVLTSGQLFEGSAQLFEGKAFDDLLTQLREKFDFIIFDGAPVMEFPDAYLLAPRLDGVILVLEADRTSVEEAQRATHNLAQAGAQILGVVLNRQKVLRPSFLKRFLGASS